MLFALYLVPFSVAVYLLWFGPVMFVAAPVLWLLRGGEFMKLELIWPDWLDRISPFRLLEGA